MDKGKPFPAIIDVQEYKNMENERLFSLYRSILYKFELESME